jgi:hypothetical protein
MAQAPNAILAISSTDRYTISKFGNVNQPVANALIAQYDNEGPYSNDFQLTAPGALLNGYIEKIIISQIQLQYNLPTVIPGVNDYLVYRVETSPGSFQFNTRVITIPFGFFVPYDLAAVIQASMNNPGDFEVNFLTTNQFEFINNANLRFLFPSNIGLTALGFSLPQIVRVLKTYKLFGISGANSLVELTQISGSQAQFLYTPYIDLYSDSLTNYQRLKDTDTSVAKRKGLITRMYLSGVGTPQPTFSYDNVTDYTLVSGVPPSQITGTSKSVTSSALGSAPFILTYDLNSPKIINWTPDVAINSLDFQMRDCYGDLLPVASELANNYESFSTEWQMTLLCVERDY